MRGEWDESVKVMVARLREVGPAAEGFQLSEDRLVIDPVKYHESMIMDADAGPKGPRSWTGAFQKELAMYLKVREIQAKS